MTGLDGSERKSEINRLKLRGGLLGAGLGWPLACLRPLSLVLAHAEEKLGSRGQRKRE